MNGERISSYVCWILCIFLGLQELNSATNFNDIYQ
jgi:hypothetical protein